VNDDATLYRKLRAETIGLLGLDPAALTTAQGVKVDLVSSLRLALDALTARQLKGETIDLTKLLSAAEALERLLPRAAAFSAEVTESHGARNRLAALVDAHAEVIDQDKDAKIAELETLLAEKIAALTALLGSPPVTAQNCAVETPPPVPPQPQTSPQPPPSSAPPAHYLRQPDGSEPWRMAESGRRLSGKDWGSI
jgi:hypothetical protein